MSRLGDLCRTITGRRMTGGDRPLERCEVHAVFQADCPMCVRLNQARNASWETESYSPVEPMVFFDASQTVDPIGGGFDASSTPDSFPDVATDSASSDGGFSSSDSGAASGFDGFDGGSSGGGGASGDW